MERFLISASISLLIWGMALAGLIVFGTSNPPTAAAAITGPFAHIDDRNFPALRCYQARDGAQLSYREYAASGRQVAVLIHGSAGSSRDMHPLAVALQGRGVTVLVPDLRGHGANGPHGDISYVGQLDDDLADLVAKKKPELPDTVWTAVGLSSGGGFALRVAAEFPIGKEFDRYILVSPYLKYNAPSVRQAASGTKPGSRRGQPRPQRKVGRRIYRQDHRAHDPQFRRGALLGRLARHRLPGTCGYGFRDSNVLVAPTTKLWRP